MRGKGLDAERATSREVVDKVIMPSLSQGAHR